MNFLLVTRAPYDGYPPVQYQAQLLCRAGHTVTVVTTRLGTDRPGGVTTNGSLTIQRVEFGSQSRISRLAGNVRFAVAVLRARMRLGRSDLVEICYDPDGIWFSDVVPLRPRRRVAHLHELLASRNRFEHRLGDALANVELVVVPDRTRARITKEDLGLKETPLVIENFPLLDTCQAERSRAWCEGGLRVVYCGSIGTDQELEPLIESLPLWRPTATLTVIGNHEGAVGRRLVDRVEQMEQRDRVRFLGWKDRTEAERIMASSDLGYSVLEATKGNWRTSLGASNKRYQLMKAGIPQVSDCNPGVRDLIEGALIGKCLDVVTPEAIARVVNSYADQPEECQAAGGRARRLFEQRYNYEAVMPRLLAALDLPFDLELGETVETSYDGAGAPE